MGRRFLLLAVLTAMGCRTSDRAYLDRTERVRQRESEYDSLGVARVLADREVDRTLMEQQDNRK